MIQTYNGPLRQSTPVVPSGNCSKAKSNCIFCCLLSFQCHLEETASIGKVYVKGEEPVQP